MKARRAAPSLERLEDRYAPATWGNPWPDPSHLTLSFVPDGTLVAGHRSNLFQTLDALAPTKTWQNTILRAFQTWATQANINLAVVPDQGLPLGSPGAIQSDARFGDIRIAAYAMPPTAAAGASPFELDAGTWSGDVELNSAVGFSVDAGRVPGSYDLFSVMLHEAGHVFGLPDNSNPASVLDINYAGVRTGLGTVDISALQRLYGTRTPDIGTNNSFKNATRLTGLSNLMGVLSATADATIVSLQDQDYYSFNTLLGLGAVDVTLRTDGISLLTPQVTIYNASRRIIAQAATTDPTAGGLVIHLSNVAPLSTYTIEVQSGQQNAFGIGSYELGLSELPLVNNLLGGLTATVSQGVHVVTSALINNDPLHLDSSFATARPLPVSTGYGGTGYASYRASLSGTSDVDYFTLHAPPAAPGATTDVLTAMVWGLENSLNLQVRVFDASHNPVAGQVLVKDGFSNVVEVTNAIPGNTYFIEVLQVANSNGVSAGNYCLYVAASPVGVTLQNYLGGTLTAGQPEKVNWLRVGARSELFHFVLAAQSAGATTVQMTITNVAGHVVFSLDVGAGDAVSGDVLLDPGTYTLLFTARAGSNTAQPSLMYQLSGQTLTDPQGPESTDPSGDPSGSPGTDPNAGPDLGSGAGNGVPSQDPTSPPPNGADTPYVSLYNPGDQTSFTGAAVSVALSAYNSASNSMTYAATGLPAGVTMDGTSGVMSGTIANSAASDTAYVVSVTATDSVGSSATQTFTWTVNLPVVTVTSPGDQTNLTGDNVAMTVSASSSDSATLSYSAAGLPAGLSIDSASGMISGTIANDAATGTPYSITVTATDSTGGVSGTQTFTWTVSLPVVTVNNPGDQTNLTGDNVNMTVSASSSDSATLSYSAAGLPGGLTIDSASGMISGTIANDAATGTPYSVTITATDSTGGVSGTLTFTWTVNLPVVTVTSPGDQTNTAGDYVNMTVSGNSSDGYALAYSATGLPPGLTIDSASGAISGTLANNAGSDNPYVVTVTATDASSGVSTSVTFNWTVAPPVVTVTSPGGQTNGVGDTISFAVSAAASDNAPLTFTATGLPPGLSIDGTTGLISGTVSNEAAGVSYDVSLTVTDPSSGVSVTVVFNWQIG